MKHHLRMILVWKSNALRKWREPWGDSVAPTSCSENLTSCHTLPHVALQNGRPLLKKIEESREILQRQIERRALGDQQRRERLVVDLHPSIYYLIVHTYVVPGTSPRVMLGFKVL